MDRKFWPFKQKEVNPQKSIVSAGLMLSTLLTIHESQFRDPVAAKLRKHIDEGTVGLTVMDYVSGEKIDDRFWLSVAVDDRGKRALVVMVINNEAMESKRGDLSKDFGSFLEIFDREVKSLNLQGIALDPVPEELIPDIVVRALKNAKG